MRSIRIFAKNLGNPYYEPTIVVHDRRYHTSATKLTLFVVSKDEWDKKEGTGKSMKNALYVKRYGKRHLSSWNDIKQWKKIKPVALAIVELHKSEGIRQLVS